MIRSEKRRSEEPLDSSDLLRCQQVFEELKRDLGDVDDAEEVNRLAAITMELYRQGVRQKDQLRTMVAAARGR
ncbi:hypothetical protein J2T09_001506 [Neorhizobium huautlense]|uniref:Uncharacterized protein n=2 Tax=Rhizobiaceae TaxID=82115 RepID=A0A6A8A957_9HYPH|nr:MULTISPECIES: hypothetical protein [Rhizobiaceae]MDP9836761.1 hypothetical protein [Neorhizobium huautlense]MEB2843311.1 hypothetical protein [Endobacterium cereale]MQY47269.1 hypothetical protein [Endobacterium cereale]